MDCPSPLKPEHCATLNKLLQSCAETREMLHRMKQSGIDTADMEAVNEAQHAFAKANKASWFPDQP
jgi:hypothetical protein